MTMSGRTAVTTADLPFPERAARTLAKPPAPQATGKAPGLGGVYAKMFDTQAAAYRSGTTPGQDPWNLPGDPRAAASRTITCHERSPGRRLPLPPVRPMPTQSSTWAGRLTWPAVNRTRSNA